MPEKQFQMLTLEGRDGKRKCVKFAALEDDREYALQLHEALEALFRSESGYTLGPVTLDNHVLPGSTVGHKYFVEES
jgi:hypothetical protein